MRGWTLWFSTLALAMSLGLGTTIAADAPARVVPNSPLTPEESRQHFQIDPDCRIELVAAEPDVSAPVSIAFDEKGQLWVVEMHDYPNGPAPGEPGKSRIRVLTDEDGDGRYSNPRVFVDQLLFANSLMHWDGGILVTTDGKLVYFKDTDGDGKADLREVWFEGFATENPQLRCNHPTFGPDNWIYVANGLRNGKVRAVRPKWPQPAPESAKLGEPVDIAGRDFRFNPFTGECEAVSGYGQFGLTFDDEGNRYVCSNRNPCMKIIIEERHLKLNPNLAVPSVYEDVSPAGEKSKLYPISRAWTTSNLHAGQFSAACGLIFYRGTALPEKFYNQSFTCDPTGNLVHFNDQTYNEAKREFLASDETWFRPVNTAMGPDGALYVVDMYRAVIEHPDYMPVELKTRSDLATGAERGRIWRIKSKTGEPGGVSPRSLPVPTDPVEIAKLVTHPNGWHRDMAQRLIVQQSAIHGKPLDGVSIGSPNYHSDVDKELRKILRREPSDVGSVVALRTLDGIGTLTGDDLAVVIQRESLDESVVLEKRVYCFPQASDLVIEAARIAERFIQSSPTLQDKILLLGHSSDSRGAIALINLALGALGQDSRESRIEMAIEHLVASDRRESTPLSIGLGEGPFLAPIVLETLKRMNARRLLKDGPAIRESIPSSLLSEAIRSGLLEEAKGILEQLLVRQDVNGVMTCVSSLANRGVTVDSLVQQGGTIQAPWNQFVEQTLISCRDSNDEQLLLNSIPMLRYLNAEIRLPSLNRLLTSELSPGVIRQALQVTASLADPQGIEMLLANFSQRTPALRSTVIDGLLATEPRITKLLDLVESNQISFLEVGQTRLASLQQVKNPEIQERLQKLIVANAPADRSKVLEEYQAALTHEHDPLRGRELFSKNCAQCHKIGDLGVEVAPNISDSRVKTQAQLLTDILDPNRAIDNNYFSYTLVDTAGTVATGIVAAETSSSVTLKQPEGKTITVLRSDIEQLKPNGVSLMPVGFEKQLSVAQMADVISFIKNWRYLDGQVPIEVIK